MNSMVSLSRWCRTSPGPGSGREHHPGRTRPIWRTSGTGAKKYDREWLPAQPKTVSFYLDAGADELSLATLEPRLAAIASLDEEEGYESPASVAEGPLRTIWKGIVREKTRQQDRAPLRRVEGLKRSRFGAIAPAPEQLYLGAHASASLGNERTSQLQ
jgi:hypothetical protein